MSFDDEKYEKQIRDLYKEHDMTYKKHCNNISKPNVVIKGNLQVELDNNNKVIYLCPGRLQYFTFKILKSCGEVYINNREQWCNSAIIGKLGRYKIVGNGVAVYTKCKLNPEDIDVLYFTAKEKCTNSCINFAAIFSYNPCKTQSRK